MEKTGKPRTCVTSSHKTRLWTGPARQIAGTWLACGVKSPGLAPNATAPGRPAVTFRGQQWHSRRNRFAALRGPQNASRYMSKQLKTKSKRRLCSTAMSRRAARRREGGPARNRRRRSRLHGGRHRGARRPGTGAAPARHVYRRHRRKGAASPLRRSHRQLDGRGAGRARDLHRRRAQRRRLPHRHRQRPRHPDRSASEVPEEVGARSHHVHAAFGRQVRQQGLRDLGRSARRRHLRGERPLLAARGRGRAQPETAIA